LHAKIAKDLARLIRSYGREGRNYTVESRKLQDRQLTEFHQWADNRPCEGAFLISGAGKSRLWAVLIDWKLSENYYLAIFPEARSGPLAEIHECLNDGNSNVLRWKYSPTKQDKKNPERRAYFAEVFNSKEVLLSVPESVDQVDDFFAELFSLAVARLKADALDPARPPTREGFPEGKLKEHLHRSRERNPELIRLAKQLALSRDGCLRCACCAFNFEQVYGPLGRGFIEGHHTKPVSTLHIDGELTKVEDIALVCSNCHRMLHRRRPWLRIGHLADLLK
jgi:hypothetical protein